MTDPWRWWSAEQIATATDCPLGNVQEHWPKIAEQLELCGIWTPNVAIGVLGTSAIETASQLAPVQEGFYLGEPEPASTHRAGLAYAPYYGRGHVQLTHAENYRLYGQKVADLWAADPTLFDFVADPDAALDPNNAAAVIALWFRDTRALPTESYPEGYTLVQACEAQDWEWVRILVYGGEDAAGAARIADIAAELGPPAGETIVPEPAPLPTYDQHYPAFAQNDDWSCAPTSARWALWAYGEDSSESWVEGTMLAEGVVSTTYGLLDHTGAGLAAFLQRHFQAADAGTSGGYSSTNSSYVTFDEVAQEAAAGRHPLMLGGQAYCHWTGVRGFDGTRLVLANPAPGWPYGTGPVQHMSREQFSALGKFSLVRLVHEAAEAVTPPGLEPGPDPSDPFAPWRGAIGTGLLELMAQDGTLPAQRVSTWLPLGVSPADIEEASGQNGVLYRWLLTVGRGERFRPA